MVDDIVSSPRERLGKFIRELHIREITSTLYVKTAYKALYPLIIDENNIAPNTMYGKIFIPEQLDIKENRFNNDYYDRSVWMIEDLVCRDRLNFCSRYLNLLSYEEMFDSILEYFTKVKDPEHFIRYTDSITGLRYMVETRLSQGKPREMCKIVNNSKPYTKVMCVRQERMPRQ